jgi:hypothetical protein
MTILATAWCRYPMRCYGDRQKWVSWYQSLRYHRRVNRHAIGVGGLRGGHVSSHQRKSITFPADPSSSWTLQTPGSTIIRAPTMCGPSQSSGMQSSLTGWVVFLEQALFVSYPALNQFGATQERVQSIFMSHYRFSAWKSASDKYWKVS